MLGLCFRPSGDAGTEDFPSTVYRFYTEAEVTRLLQDGGFDDVSVNEAGTSRGLPPRHRSRPLPRARHTQPIQRSPPSARRSLHLYKEGPMKQISIVARWGSSYRKARSKEVRHARCRSSTVRLLP